MSFDFPSTLLYAGNVPVADTPFDGATARWVLIGAAGNVAVKLKGQSTFTVFTLAVGVFHRLECTELGNAASGTTATSIRVMQ